MLLQRPPGYKLLLKTLFQSKIRSLDPILSVHTHTETHHTRRSTGHPPSGEGRALPSDMRNVSKLLVFPTSSSLFRVSGQQPTSYPPRLHISSDESPGNRHAPLALTCEEPGGPALQESPRQPEGKRDRGARHPAPGGVTSGRRGLRGW